MKLGFSVGFSCGDHGSEGRRIFGVDRYEVFRVPAGGCDRNEREPRLARSSFGAGLPGLIFG